MTLDQIRDFLALVQHGSVHAAARAQGRTQPAMTRSLRRLEGTLGAMLFERHARGLHLNDFGREFLGHARRLQHEAQRTREAMDQALGHRRGTVTFGISAAASLLLAPAAIRRFRHDHPEVELRSRSGLHHTLAPLLHDGLLDFMICPLPAGGVDSLFSRRTLIDSAMVLVARQGHALAGARTLREVQHAGFVAGGPRGQPGGGIHDIFEQAGLGSPRIELHSDSLLESLAMVLGSDCLALLPQALLLGGLMQGRLAVLPVAEALPSYAVGLFGLAGVPLTSVAEALATQFEREAHYRRQPSP